MRTIKTRSSDLYPPSYTAGVTDRQLLAQLTPGMHRAARRFRALGALSALLLAGVLSTSAAGAEAAPATPTGDAAAVPADTADDDANADRDPNDPVQRARQGVVVLERAGKVIGLGTVLAGDGRILAALSTLSHGNNIDARFADGSVSQVKIGHTDRAWDLALLVPQNARWKKGLRASRVDPTRAGLSLRTFSLMGNNKDFAPARTLVKSRSNLLGGDSEILQDALELVTRIKESDLGSPLLDDNGDVVAILAHACAKTAANQPCARVPYGVPVSAVKAFLRTAPAKAVPPAPWLGIQGVADDVGPARGVRILGVHPKSPAGAAGLKGGADKMSADTVVAIDGVPVMTPEALAKAINEHAVGDSVQVLLFGRGKFRQVTLQLRAAPEPAARPAAAAVAPRPAEPKRPARPARPPAPTSPAY